MVPFVANPFTPTFGVSPPVLAGRTDLIADFADALDDGPGSPGRATLYTGARGTGKTVMLNEVEDVARARGWLVVSETATPGFVDRIVTEHLPAILREVDPHGDSIKLTGITAPMGLGGATWESETTHQPVPGLRNQLALVCDLLAASGTGMLITLDEIHHHRAEELREMVTTLQHLMREGREISFVGAGLPSAVNSILNDEVLTFLRRADLHYLGSVAEDEGVAAIRKPIVDAGRAISDADARRAAGAAGGYPFLIQLVGYQTWRQHPEIVTITADDVSSGIADARRRLGRLVHEPALAALSDVDRSFLLAMSRDDGPSRMSDIAERLRVDANYASQYRRRLMAAQMIESAGRGLVDLTMPFLREHLREQSGAGS